MASLTSANNQQDPTAQVDPEKQQKLEDQALHTFVNSDKGKEIAAWVKKEYNAMKSARLQQQRKWYINLSMFYGEQYYEILSPRGSAASPFVNGMLGVPKAPKHRVRTTVNKIRPTIRTEISKMTSQKPTATVIPATGEDDDMAAALAGEAIWEYLQSTNQFSNTIMMRHSFWKAVCGTAFIKTWWDSCKVDQYSKLTTGDQAQGCICYGVVTPFNLYIPDYTIPEIEDQPYVFEVYTKTTEWVKQSYPKVFPAGEDPIADCVAQSEIFETKYFQISQAAKDAAPNACLFIEAWIKPGYNKYLPDGGIITVAAGKVVQFQEGMPYEHNQYPYAKSIMIDTGMFYGHSSIEDLKHLQKEYNRTRSHIIESKNRMARPQLLVAKGSINVAKLTSEPGLVIEYEQGFTPPQPLPTPELPVYVIQEQDRINQDWEDISGQHQVSKGMAPGGGVEAATAISFLQEQDDSLLYGTYASIEAMTEKVAKQSLTLVGQYWDLPRIIRVVGSDGAFDSFEFKGSDIAQGMDIRVEAGSALPQSKPARQAFLMDMFRNGAIDANQLLDLLDIGGVQKLTERIRIDTKAAQRENLKMKMLDPMLLDMYGQQMQMEWQQGSDQQQNPATGVMNYTGDPTTWPPLVPVNEWDNHQVHIDTHNSFRKGQEFETLPQEIKDEFARHIRTHQMALSVASMQSMMGAPGGAGMGMPPGADQSSGMPPSPSASGGAPSPMATVGEQSPMMG